MMSWNSGPVTKYRFDPWCPWLLTPHQLLVQLTLKVIGRLIAMNIVIGGYLAMNIVICLRVLHVLCVVL